MTEDQKKRESMEIKEFFYINLHLNLHVFRNGIHRRADAKGTADIIYRM